MIINYDLQFSDDQTLAADDYSATVEIASQSTGVDQAVQVIVRSESGDDPTLLVALEVSGDNVNWKKVAAAHKPEGDHTFAIPLQQVAGLKRYLRLRYFVTGTYNLTAFLVDGIGHGGNTIQHMPASPRHN